MGLIAVFCCSALINPFYPMVEVPQSKDFFRSPTLGERALVQLKQSAVLALKTDRAQPASEIG